MTGDRVPAFDDLHQLAHAIVESSDDLVFTKDAQGRYRFANAAVLQALGLGAGDLLGRDDFEVLPRRVAQVLMANDQRVLETGATVEAEETVPGPDGQPRHHLVRKVPLRDAQGRVAGVLGIGRDITARRQAEDQRDAIRLKLEMGVQAAGLVMAEIDYVTNCNQISAELARLLELGDGPTTVPRQAIFDRIHPDDRARYLEGIARATDPRGTGHLAIQARALLPSGTVRWLDIRLQVTFAAVDGELRPSRGMCAARDVTAQVLADQALRTSEARFRAATQAASEIVWTTDPAGRLTGDQPSWAAFTGQSREQYQGYGWTDAVHPDDAGPTLDAWQRAVAARERFAFQNRLRRHDGAWRTFSIRAVPVCDDAGEVREWVGVHTDITDLLAASQARAEAEQRYRQLFENMTEEVHFWQLEREPGGRVRTWRLLDANAPALATWGRQLQDIRGRTADEIFGPGTTEHYRPVVEQVLREQRPFSYDDWFAQLGRHFRFTTVPLGESFITTGTDVTAIREAQQTIERQNDELREADARKDRFLATLSHELRNPLAPIRTAAELLGRPGLDAQQLARSRAIIQRQVGQMALLLDDLLDVARITQGTLALRRERVGLAGMVDSAVEAVRPLLARKRHQLDVQLPQPDPVLDADPVRLAQVISNLLANAAKYTDPDGHIALRAQVAQGALVLEVQDDGMGLSARDLPQLFEMFSPVRDTSDRSEGGLGVGLSLVKALVELHGGRVSASSPGAEQGSTFRVELPLAPGDSTSAVPPPATAAAAPGPRRVLVADDNRDAADTLALLLGMGGHAVQVAYDGAQAVRVAREFRPDVALLDIGMPGMSGHEVARALRQEPWAAGLLLVAVTGWGQEEDRRLAREAGFDRHVTKPVEPAVVEALLAGR